MNLDLTRLIETGAGRLDDAAPGWADRLSIKDGSGYGFIHPGRHVPRGYEDALILAELNRASGSST